ncbi:MAG: DNA polymerase I, partial [Eubacteriaceae bacterium]
CVAFDLSGPTFRHLAFDDYKGGRNKMPEELQKQFPILKEILGKMGVTIREVEGYEADDIIGTLALLGEEQNIQTEIITGDRDAFQLVGPHTKVLFTKKGISELEEVDEEWISENYGGLKPSDLIELKALMGDKSDNIPGVPGIGEKTGIKLLQKYGNLENLYDHIDEEKGKQKEKLIEGKDDAYLSRMLGKIVQNVPGITSFEGLEFKNIFNPESIELLKELEFKTILSKIEIEVKAPENEKPLQFIKIKTESAFQDLMKGLRENNELVIYYHKEDEDVYFGLYFKEKYYYLDSESVQEFHFFQEFKELPNLCEIRVISQDIKNLLHIFHHHDISCSINTFDTYIATYLLSSGDQRYDLKTAAYRYLNRSIADNETIFGKGKSLKKAKEIDEALLMNYIMRNCETIYDLKIILEKELINTGMWELYKTMEIPLLEVMASMEELGFKIDIEELEKLSKNFEEKLESLTEEIYALAGNQEFNINSPKQLGTILFDELKLPVVKKTKTGYSTNIEVLEQLTLFHPIVQKIIDYRGLAKLDSTYGRGLMSYVDSNTQRIYSTFNQTVAATGRLSSSDPNLQNIPVKTEMGREIRKVFIPSGEDHVLVDADYSQIELRVLAHLSEDENLIDAFVKNQDIHTRTASEIFGVALDEVTREERGKAKAINFGLIYGKQAFSLGKDLGITRNEAQAYIDLYFSRYPKIKDYMENIKKEGKEKGYVTTIWGRRRYIPEMNSRNAMLVQAGERMALNTPIQGSAADIIKLAMLRVYDRLKNERLKAKLILQVHDELMIDAPKSEQLLVEVLLKEEMETAADLLVPLTVDVKSGTSWFETK